MEEFTVQRWNCHKKFENVVQGTMIVLVVVALLILAFAPEDHAGASVRANPPVPGDRSHGSLPVNPRNQPAKNRN